MPEKLKCLAEVELCDTDIETEVCAREVEVFGRG